MVYDKLRARERVMIEHVQYHASSLAIELELQLKVSWMWIYGFMKRASLALRKVIYSLTSLANKQ